MTKLAAIWVKRPDLRLAASMARTSPAASRSGETRSALPPSSILDGDPAVLQHKHAKIAPPATLRQAVHMLGIPPVEGDQAAIRAGCDHIATFATWTGHCGKRRAPHVGRLMSHFGGADGVQHCRRSGDMPNDRDFRAGSAGKSDRDDEETAKRWGPDAVSIPDDRGRSG